jgi:methionyl-tRNA formyltransferase
MRIVFFGSSDFSVPFLESVKNEAVLVVTAPDKRKNRGKKLLPNPVKVKAEDLKIPFILADKLTEVEAERIRSVSPELFVVVSYGIIIPKFILDIVPCAINVHPSKVPLYRGASPIIRQIMDGVEDSAVSIIKVSERLDRGDVILQKPFKIEFTDTREDVENKVIKIGKELLIESIAKVQNEGCVGQKQTGKGTYAKKITKHDELIKWGSSCVSIYNQVRALYPSPCAFTFFRGKRVKILRALPVDSLDAKSSISAGEILEIGKENIAVKCGRGVLKILTLQVEGKKPISARDFINGMRPKIGEKFGK